jgi:hypothetical protein
VDHLRYDAIDLCSLTNVYWIISAERADELQQELPSLSAQFHGKSSGNEMKDLDQPDRPKQGKEAVERSHDTFLEFQEIDRHQYESRSQAIDRDLRDIDRWRPSQMNFLEAAR